jgi:single-strand DNA-binding protein
MNSLTIVGRLATDIRLETPKGKPIATFRVAIDRAGAEGADFIPVKCFGSAAENHARYLAKGRQVAIVGRLSQSQWTDEAGNRRERLEVIGVRVEYLGAPIGTAASDSDETGDAEEEAF